jgi:cytochrome c oxidase subunit 2
MRYIQKISLARSTALFIVILVMLLAACTPTAVTPNSLNPQGPAAARIMNLWWLAMGLGLFTYLLVLGCLLLALWRRRQPGRQQAEKWQRYGHGLILGGGLIFPVIVLIILYGFTLNTLSALSLPHTSDRVLIEVVGHQWWWEVNYPHHRIHTANEIHIPVGEPVQLQLTSADVIHSFWVPELHGKLDLVPGRTNNWWLQADTPGEYWGLCAESCGTQHARMLFVVVAEPEAAFEAWLTIQAQPAAEPGDEVSQRGQTLFMETGCSNCHTIQGTAATGDLGPDLTHFASRLTLGAGTAPNNRGHLAGWVVDPHGLKPGSLMPATPLTSADLTALLAYLESLE